MKSSHPFVRYCVCVSTAAACAAAMAMRLPQQEPPEVPAGEWKAAHLDCARVSPGRLLEPDLVIVCSMVAQVREGREARPEVMALAPEDVAPLMHWQR